MINIKLPIKELGLNTRALNWLKTEANIKTIEDLILHESILLKYPNIGNVTDAHIKEKLAIHNLYLKTDRKFLKKQKKKMTNHTLHTCLTQLRDLTDREIASICKKHLAPKNCDIYTFAKAILQRAREK